jgi:hypothetical protein
MNVCCVKGHTSTVYWVANPTRSGCFNPQPVIICLQLLEFANRVPKTQNDTFA